MRLHHQPQEQTTPTAPVSKRSGQVGHRGTRPCAVIDIRSASLEAQLRASVRLAQQKEGKP